MNRRDGCSLGRRAPRKRLEREARVGAHVNNVIYLAGGAGKCTLQDDSHEASEEVDEDLAPVGSVSHCSVTGLGPQRAGLKRLM